MDPEEPVTLIIPATIEFVLGISLNLYILLVYIGNLKNGVSLGPSHRVHLTKALVNISLHGMMIAQYFICAFWPNLLLKNEVFAWNTTINMSLCVYSYWLTALICLYYCTNITTCGHHVFVWLKRSLLSYFLHILLVSGLGSVALSIPAYWFCGIELPGNRTSLSIILHGEIFKNITYKTTSSILGCFLPFAIALVSTTFTSWSLIKHMWRMRQNIQGFTWSKFQTQIKATRTMILFLLISVIYNAIQMCYFASLSKTSSDVTIVIWMIMISYPVSEAVIIIQSSLQLRSTLLGMFCDRDERKSEADS